MKLEKWGGYLELVEYGANEVEGERYWSMNEGGRLWLVGVGLVEIVWWNEVVMFEDLRLEHRRDQSGGRTSFAVFVLSFADKRGDYEKAGIIIGGRGVWNRCS
ncbi:MAG: hypothetical protein N2035_08495 [Chthoniobacterales bacterium]|nr:hypothetical protein [Chthoniobacterales bacterium]